ncbi:MAG: 3-oxoacyl-[acyl-carrier-protein] reductase FabG [Pseudomonas citronellolis]|nr:MAG: 3-oxoacyl-[acyl-carrier-protein] reductase FabG [Pseudomonas citronellolis]
MADALHDRVVAITGAFGHLGHALAEAVVAEGGRVALIGRGWAGPLQESLGDTLVLERIDLSEPALAREAVVRIQAHFGRLDALVNAAGAFRWETVEDGNLSTWDELYQANLRTAVSTTQAALALLRASPAGRIVNIGSAAASRGGLGMAAYTAAKAGVQRFSESLAEELKGHGATVNVVLPGIIDTAQNRLQMPDADRNTWVTPEEVAAVVLFLLGDAARAVTGASIPVTGRL